MHPSEIGHLPLVLVYVLIKWSHFAWVPQVSSRSRPACVGFASPIVLEAALHISHCSVA